MTRNRQLGVTALGWLILLTPFAIVIYAGIRLAPVYLNYMKVAKAIDQAGNELKGGGVNASSIKTAIDKHFEIDMVDYPSTKDFKITRDGGQWVVEACVRRRRAAVLQHLPARHLRQGRKDRQARAPASSARLARRCARAAHERRRVAGALGARAAGLRAARPCALPRRAHPPQRRRPNNERLEFLGDSVLNLAHRARALRRLPAGDRGGLEPPARAPGEPRAAGGDRRRPRHRRHPADWAPGNSRAAASAASRSWRMPWRRCCGAIFLDGGLDAVAPVIARLFAARIAALPEPEALKDAKTRLAGVPAVTQSGAAALRGHRASKARTTRSASR